MAASGGRPRTVPRTGRHGHRGQLRRRSHRQRHQPLAHRRDRRADQLRRRNRRTRRDARADDRLQPGRHQLVRASRPGHRRARGARGLRRRHGHPVSPALTHRDHVWAGGTVMNTSGESPRAMTAPISRRRFFTAAGGAAATMMLGTACSSTYDIAGGFVSPASGSSNRTIVYWNLLSGGDGAHMQEMEATFQREYPHISLDATVLTWGNPYYTKLAMAIRAGAPPDVAIMHLTRLP